MRTNKKNLQNQREIIEKKLHSWVSVRGESAPPSGWIRAIRGALGINTRQLATHLSVDHSAVLQLEKREVQGKVTLELLEKVAQAMDCKLVYAVVPREDYRSLGAIIENRARTLAKELMRKIEHSMRLERQGDSDYPQPQIDRLAHSLIEKMDTRLWNAPSKKAKK